MAEEMGDLRLTAERMTPSFPRSRTSRLRRATRSRWVRTLRDLPARRRLALLFTEGVVQMENPLIGRRVQEEGGRFEGTIAAVGIDQAPGPSAEFRWSFVVVADSGLVGVIKAHGATVTGWERPAM